MRNLRRFGIGFGLARQRGWSMYRELLGLFPIRQASGQVIHIWLPANSYVSVILKQFLQAQLQTPHMLPGKSSSRDFVAERRSHLGQIAAAKGRGDDPFSNAFFQRVMWHQWPPGHPAEFMKAAFQPTCQRTSSHHRKHLCGFPL